MTNPNALPAPELGQEPPAAGVDPSLNPFAGNPPVEQQPSRLGLGANILSQAGVHIPAPAAEARQSSEVVSSVQKAAKKACGLIAEMFIKEGDPDSIVFPICNDMDVIGESLKQIANTPLGLGYGDFPSSVSTAWSRFMRETAEHYRSNNGLEVADLVPLTIEMPAWLRNNPTFDVLSGCTLMDIKVIGLVNSVVAHNANICRIRFTDAVDIGANIGADAKRSTFIFDSYMHATQSFKNASNISVSIERSHSGQMGPVSRSKVTCEGEWQGTVIYKGNECSFGPGVKRDFFG